MSPAKRVTPRRRDYGTGTLRVVRGAWLASWYAADGRRVQRKIGAARTEGRSDGLTKAQAEKALRQIREGEAPTGVARSRRVTMEEGGAELCRRLELKGRKKSHRLTVASDLRNHIVPFFGDRTLDRITPDDIERYIAVKQRTLAIKTIRNHIVTIHSVFEAGLRKGWCVSNPVKLADRPVIRTTETRIKYLDQDELEKLLAVTYPDDAFGRIEPTLYLTAAMTGLRQGELLGLRWRDIDFEARRVRVVSPFVRGEFGDPKSEGSGRSVPLAERVAVALRELHEQSMYPRDRDLVFCHRTPATPWTARSWSVASSRPSCEPTSTTSPSTSYATPSGRVWPRRARRCGRCSTGWGMPTPRPPRSTRTTNRQKVRRMPSIAPLRDLLAAVATPRAPNDRGHDCGTGAGPFAGAGR